MAEVGGRKIREGLLRGEKNREVRQYEKKGNNLDTGMCIIIAIGGGCVWHKTQESTNKTNKTQESTDYTNSFTKNLLAS